MRLTKTKQYIIIGIILLVLGVFVYMKIKHRSTYSYPTMASETGNPVTAFNAGTTQCEVQYLLDQNANNPLGAANFANCIASNVNTYINARCPYLPTSPTAASAISSGAGLVNTVSNTYYVNYLADVSAVNTPYLTLEASETDPTVLNYISLARNADLTGPTRKFYSFLCPGLYNTSNISDSVTSIYQGWSSTAATTSPYGFVPVNVTRARVIEWAKYASPNAVFSVGSANQLVTNDPPTVPLTTGCTNFSSNTVPASVTTNMDPNYLTARQNGPGTVNTSVVLPWNTTGQAGC